MTSIVLDIETLPDMRPGAREYFVDTVKADFKAPSTLTKEKAALDLGMDDPEKIKFTSKDSMLAKWVERFRDEKADEVADAEWRKTSFDAAKGQICCIGWSVDDDEPESDHVIAHSSDERDVMRFFFSELRKAHSADPHRRPLFIGHNNVAFDLPFIFRRAVILGIEPPKFLPAIPRPWDESVFDTMYQWAGHGNRISMDALCEALGIPGKDSMDGSMVCDAYLDGRIADIAEYCRGDVWRTRQIYRLMTFQSGQLSIDLNPELLAAA